MSQTACIVYGFMEGPRHGHRMRQALRDRGYRVVKSQRHANLIVAHSGAHLLVRVPKVRQQVLIIDASCNTGRHVFDNALRHVWYDLVHVLGNGQVQYYAWKTWWNAVYFFLRPLPAWRMYRRIRRPDYLPVRFAGKAVITQGDDRSWYRPESLPLEEIVFMSGDHDDCWRNPDRYLDLINALQPPKPTT
ncbi:hypothetical protein IPL85_03890 [Candidatus Saccharibacteria bacterium]|nr:MAG: hypothetical protein IPL85_03890 [Candidatus Saccharibacteria bacterium]